MGNAHQLMTINGALPAVSRLLQQAGDERQLHVIIAQLASRVLPDLEPALVALRKEAARARNAKARKNSERQIK